MKIAGLRWAVEDCFETAKSDCGPDQYEVRKWEPWHRHIAPAIAAFAFLSVSATRTARLTQPREDTQPPTEPEPEPEPATAWPPLTPPPILNP